METQYFLFIPRSKFLNVCGIMTSWRYFKVQYSTPYPSMGAISLLVLFENLQNLAKPIVSKFDEYQRFSKLPLTTTPRHFLGKYVGNTSKRRWPNFQFKIQKIWTTFFITNASPHPTPLFGVSWKFIQFWDNWRGKGIKNKNPVALWRSESISGVWSV